MIDPVRQRARHNLLFGLMAALILGVPAAVLGSQLVLTAAGNSAWQEGDYVSAANWHTRAVEVAFVERWLPHYNRGVARFGARSWLDAARDFARASELAPENRQCTIRLNWAWSLEAAGDELDATNDRPSANRLWNEAQYVLSDTDCPQEQRAEQPEQINGPDQGGDTEHVTQPKGSSAAQQSDTIQRLQQKQTGQRESGPGASQDPAGELESRERQAQEELQRSIDEQNPPPPGQGENRSW